MATYKVPQDVEADDKLIGPFSFRQFIYLIIVAMAGFLTWALAQVFIPLAIIPLPFIIFFGALALPLRKDQPMEIYMAAIVSFYLKPRLRKWDPEGVETLIEISAPKVVEVQRTKDLSQVEAAERLSYLANIVDSGGWAIRGVQAQPGAINNDIYLEAQSAPDVLDTTTSIARNFDQMMSASTNKMHEEAKARMMSATQTTAQDDQTTAQVSPDPIANNSLQSASSATAPDINPEDIKFNPYPTFHQSIIQPLNDTDHRAESDIEPVIDSGSALASVLGGSTTGQGDSQTNDANNPAKTGENTNSTSDTQLTADIINLANNPDLSIETIAHEAQRIHKKAKKQDPDEVVISLR